MSVLLLICSLALLYPSPGQLFIGSPAIVLAALFFARYIRAIARNMPILVALLVVGGVVAINPLLEVKELLRLIFVVGSFFVFYHLRRMPGNYYRAFLVVFTAELVARLVSSDLSVLNVYTIKAGAGIFEDSNFVGLFLVFALMGLMDNECKDKVRLAFPIVLLLLLTFSRTAWIMCLAYAVARRSIAAGVIITVVSAAIPFWFLVNDIQAADIDGSLATKIAILGTFLHVYTTSQWDILMGLGREMPSELAEALSGTSYQGHTVYGQVVQYGLVINVCFYMVAYALLRKIVQNPWPVLLTCLTGGFLGLSPSSYFGLIIMIYGVFRFLVPGRARQQDIGAPEEPTARGGL